MQGGVPELPSAVQNLPPDLFAWGMLLAGVFLVLHVYARWLLRRPAAEPDNVSPESEEGLSLHQELQQLRNSLQHLSHAQKLEAMALSVLLRHACGQRWSATEKELLATCSEDSRAALTPLLVFSIHILFADGRVAHKEWESILDQTEAWLQDFVPADDNPGVQA